MCAAQAGHHVRCQRITLSITERGFALLAMVTGSLLVLVGVAIILEPQILVWIAALAIFTGASFVVVMSVFRRMMARYVSSEA